MLNNVNQNTVMNYFGEIKVFKKYTKMLKKFTLKLFFFKQIPNFSIKKVLKTTALFHLIDSVFTRHVIKH